jgi:hypothetical protein
LNQQPAFFSCKELVDLDLDRQRYSLPTQYGDVCSFILTKRESGFAKLPVVRRSEYRGPSAEETLSQFLARDGKPTDPITESYTGHLYYQCANVCASVISRNKTAITYYLAPDWNFQGTEDAARECSGHKLNGHRNAGPRVLLYRVLLDLDRALQTQFGRQIPTQALSVFGLLGRFSGTWRTSAIEPFARAAVRCTFIALLS